MKYPDQGCLQNDILVNVAIVKVTTSKKFPESQLGKITSHPRFLRYLGTCLNPISLSEINIVSDFFVGASVGVSTKVSDELLNTNKKEPKIQTLLASQKQ